MLNGNWCECNLFLVSITPILDRGEKRGEEGKEERREKEKPTQSEATTMRVKIQHELKWVILLQAHHSMTENKTNRSIYDFDNTIIRSLEGTSGIIFFNPLHDYWVWDWVRGQSRVKDNTGCVGWAWGIVLAWVARLWGLESMLSPALSSQRGLFSLSPSTEPQGAHFSGALGSGWYWWGSSVLRAERQGLGQSTESQTSSLLGALCSGWNWASSSQTMKLRGAGFPGSTVSLQLNLEQLLGMGNHLNFEG